MYYVGLDVHARLISVCILDSNGQVVKKLTYEGSWGDFPRWLRRQVEGRFAVVLEACCGWLFYELIRLGANVCVARPGAGLLRTIRGVGPRTAEAVVAYIDKPQRSGAAGRWGLALRKRIRPSPQMTNERLTPMALPCDWRHVATQNKPPHGLISQILALRWVLC